MVARFCEHRSCTSTRIRAPDLPKFCYFPSAMRMNAGCPIGNPKPLTSPRESVDGRPIIGLRGLIWCAVAGLFRSRAALQAESFRH